MFGEKKRSLDKNQMTDIGLGRRKGGSVLILIAQRDVLAHMAHVVSVTRNRNPTKKKSTSWNKLPGWKGEQPNHSLVSTYETKDHASLEMNENSVTNSLDRKIKMVLRKELLPPEARTLVKKSLCRV